MENALASLISGICSIGASLGAVYLKHYLESRERISKAGSERGDTTRPSETDGGSPREVEPAPRAPATSYVPTSYIRPIGIVVGSFLFGMAVRAGRPFLNIDDVHYEFVIALVVLVGLVLAFAIFHRRKGYQSAFQLENIALWSGFASGWSLVHGGIWSDFFAVSIPWWLGCAVVGGLIVSVGRTRNAEAETPSDG